MTSQINPSNIDGTYPVAGQDNNSQGFRTNFTNTVTNFQYAKNEITDLQNKAVLKAALTGTTLDNDMQGSPLSNAVLSDMAYTVVTLGQITGTITVDYSAGSVQTVTLGGNGTLAFTNWPVTGTSGTVTVQVTILGPTLYTLTLPTAVSVNNVGIQGLNSSTNVITFAAAGVYSFTFSSIDNGTTISVVEVNKSLQPFNNSSEDLAASAAASLALTTSYFSTSTGETATLAAGVNGQIKTFAMYADGGDMVITVASGRAGWKSSGTGTITFTAIGQACTLQYINGKWFAIGNNGATFA